MRKQRPRLLPSAERYVAPAPPPTEYDPNAIERAASYLSFAELLDPAAVRPLAAIAAPARHTFPTRRRTTAGQETKP